MKKLRPTKSYINDSKFSNKEVQKFLEELEKKEQ